MQNNYATQIQTGADVYGSDGEKIGTVSGVADNYFVIEKGFILTTDIYVPMSAVTGIEDEHVMLSMTKDQVENADWSNAPTDDDHDHDHDHDYDQESDTDQHRADPSPMGMGTDTSDDTDRNVLERREERLVVDKKVEQAGEVHVGKHVVEDRQAVDVPVTREEVTIERRDVDRPAGGEAFSEDSIDVPVYEERVETSKEARVVEELELGKTSVTDTERVEETVRREEFDIDDDATTTRRDR
ncbi:MAG: DUF2382 domain-containing protein [Chloroflexi bacterium]|nr:DUF2382 domain-containing protein [Chloroflexota bacterium]